MPDAPNRAGTEPRTLAAEALARSDPVGWFERLHVAAEQDAVVPWNRGAPNPFLVDWPGAVRVESRDALVVGSGPGDDAEFVAGLGYRTENRFALPPEWEHAFDLVLESMTVRALPVDLRAEAVGRRSRAARSSPSRRGRFGSSASSGSRGPTGWSSGGRSSGPIRRGAPAGRSGRRAGGGRCGHRRPSPGPAR